MTTITWIVNGVECAPSMDGYENVVVKAVAECRAQKSDVTRSVYFEWLSTEIGAPFTPFDQLTEQQVLGWIWSTTVNKDAAEAEAARMVEAEFQRSQTVSPPLPWITNP